MNSNSNNARMCYIQALNNSCQNRDMQSEVTYLHLLEHLFPSINSIHETIVWLEAQAT